MKLTQEEFLLLAMIDGKKYNEISSDYSVASNTLSQWWSEGVQTRNKINRAKSLYFSRKKEAAKGKFKLLFNSPREFYFWFKAQPEVCMYCGISQEKLHVIFSKSDGTLKTKRGRGRTLELERRDTSSNNYSPENCGLACYVCNNHKSDLITSDDYIKYFSKPVYEYLNTKYKEAVSRR